MDNNLYVAPVRICKLPTFIILQVIYQYSIIYTRFASYLPYHHIYILKPNIWLNNFRQLKLREDSMLE